MKESPFSTQDLRCPGHIRPQVHAPCTNPMWRLRKNSGLEILAVAGVVEVEGCEKPLQSAEGFIAISRDATRSAANFCRAPKDSLSATLQACISPLNFLCHFFEPMLSLFALTAARFHIQSFPASRAGNTVVSQFWLFLAGLKGAGKTCPSGSFELSSSNIDFLLDRPPLLCYLGFCFGVSYLDPLLARIAPLLAAKRTKSIPESAAPLAKSLRGSRSHADDLKMTFLANLTALMPCGILSSHRMPKGILVLLPRHLFAPRSTR